jgi:drug/metabolite transporter (DMT)-like permease
VLVVVRPGFQELHWAVVLPLITATAMAFYNVITRMLASTDDPMTTIFYTGLGGTIASIVAVPFVCTQPDRWGWIGLVTIGLLGFLGHLAYIHAFTYAAPSFLAPDLGLGQLLRRALSGQLPDLHVPA